MSLPTGAFQNAATLATGSHTPYITGIYFTTAPTSAFTATMAGNGASVSLTGLTTGWLTNLVISNIGSLGGGAGYMFW